MRFFASLMISTILLANSATAADMMPVRSITVNGVAQRKVVPDEAHLNVNLTAVEAKLVDAKAVSDKKLQKLLDIIKAAGIDEKKVRTQRADIQPIYEDKRVLKNGEPLPACVDQGTCSEPSNTKNKRVLMGYRVQNMVDITVADITKVGSLMQAITDADFEKGASEEWGPLLSAYYTLSNVNKIRDEMLAEALNNAKEKAAKMAEASGSSIARVYQIQENGTPSFTFARPMMMRGSAGVSAMGMGSAAMSPPAGEQEVSASVAVMYELKD